MVEYEFEDQNQKKSFMSSVGRFIWNGETKEFCGRDGTSWGKVSLFYAIFYTVLGSFFIGLLAIFVSVMPKDLPTYYGKSSTMNVRGLNPGLGFRPQPDVESHEIRFNPRVSEHPKHGYKKYADNLEIFLSHVYNKTEDESLVINCAHNQPQVDEMKRGKSCNFDYETIFANTLCNKDKRFAYDTDEPCVLIKLNKIVSWIPDAPSGYITVNCSGEYAKDKDHVHDVTYFSEGISSGGSKESGKIDTKYFPYFSQKAYRAPFIFARFKVTPNTPVNIECRAYASNIEHDRLTKRGLTKFALYISNQTTAN